MRYKQLGNTGLFVSELSLGRMTFGPPEQAGLYHDIAGMDQASADNIVRRCVEAGINIFDTADVYTHGHAERMLGQALRNLGVARKDVVIATKIIGAKRLDQLEQNPGAMHLELDADDFSQLDSVSQLTQEYPGRMLERTAPTRMPAGAQVNPGALSSAKHQTESV